MKIMPLRQKYFFLLLIFLVLFLTAESVFNKCLADNFIPRNAAGKTQAETDKSETDPYWAKDLKRKMDKAIAIMSIMKEDIDEVEKSGIDLSGNEPDTQDKSKSWGENMRNNIDKMMKVMEIIKEDVSDIEKLDERKTDNRSEK